MRIQKILKRLAIIFLIGCIIFLAIDMFRVLKINFDFLGMQQPERISFSSTNDAVRYEPTDYLIANKDDVLAEIKNITLELKNEHITSGTTDGLFEIANINKIENYFYEYSKYAVVKYKLLNIIEDMPKIYKAIKGYSDTQLKTYFENNSVHIDNYYGITYSEEFISFAKSLSFLGNGNIKVAIVLTNSIEFDYEGDTLIFDMRMLADNGNRSEYNVIAEYYRTSDNQVTPHISFTKK